MLKLKSSPGKTLEIVSVRTPFASVGPAAAGTPPSMVTRTGTPAPIGCGVVLPAGVTVIFTVNVTVIGPSSTIAGLVCTLIVVWPGVTFTKSGVEALVYRLLGSALTLKVRFGFAGGPG